MTTKTTTTINTTTTNATATNITNINATNNKTTTTTTNTTATTTTITTLADINLGLVSKCTLVGAQTVDVYSGKYCVLNKGEMPQSEAYSQCKSSNARLPLPKNKAEMSAFLKISPNSTWIGIRSAVRGRNL